MFFHESDIAKRVPAWIIKRTEENMMYYCMGLYDAFKEAVRNYPRLKKGSKLYKAWFYDDFREYIPSAYIPERLDFSAYPLPY